MAYLKLFHIVFLFIWVGSLLALTRLMAYQAKEEAAIQLRMARLYRRMYFFVDLPSMCIALGLGLGVLILKDVNMKAAWFHMKMTCVALLIVCDVLTCRNVIQLSKNPIQGRGVKYKILHGFTALIMIGALVSIYILKQKTL